MIHQQAVSFDTKCPHCGKLNRILTSDLRDKVLGVGVNPYFFSQYCSYCDRKIGDWKAQTTRDPGVIEMLFKDIRIPDTWKTTIWMKPPRRP